MKTLGLLWNAKTETFKYQVTLSRESKIIKRKIVSCLTQIFDPLGLIGPVTTNRKLIVHGLWTLRMQSDDVFGSIQQLWKSYYDSLFKIMIYLFTELSLHGIGHIRASFTALVISLSKRTEAASTVSTNEIGETVSSFHA